MKWYWLVFIVVMSSCVKHSQQHDAKQFINKNAGIIIQINDLDEFNATIDSHDFLDQLSQLKAYKKTQKKQIFLQHIKTTNPLYFCITNQSDYSISTRMDSNYFSLDSTIVQNTASFNYKTHTLLKTIIEKDTIYSTTQDSIFIGSSNPDLLLTLLKQKEQKEQTKLLEVSNTDAPFSILLNTKNTNKTNHLFHSPNITTSQFCDSFLFDITLEKDLLYFNGITQAKDSMSLINVFKNTRPQENHLATITPNNCDGFLSVTFNDFNIFNKQLKSFIKTPDSSIVAPPFKDIIEIGAIYQEKNTLISLRSIDAITTQETLSASQKPDEIYREIPLYKLVKTNLFTNSLSPFIDGVKPTIYCILNDFFIFAENKDVLQNCIASVLNKTTYANQEAYANIKTQLANESSILSVYNAKQLSALIQQNTKDAKRLDIENYKLSALQFVYDTNFAHAHAIIKKHSKTNTKNTVSEVLNITLDAPLLNAPHFITHQSKGTKNSVVQDVNNTLYVIANTGKIRFKKQLNSPILGEIKTIDAFKNGKHQLVFATKNRVYAIDSHGKSLNGFPLKFNAPITQPLAVFDYDNNRNYRLVVTQNKSVLLYNKKGQRIKGFNFKETNETINCAPKHFRIRNKDYIVLKTNKKMHILNRRGQTRVNPKKNYNYAKTPVFNYKNTFTTTTTTGLLVSIDANGNCKSRLLGKGTHNIQSTTKTLVTFNDNKLTIKGKTTTLDFGNYTPPKLFYINTKIYISLTDLQSHKVYLFDSKSNLLEAFPVYGNSKIDLENIDNNSDIEFVTKGDKNNVLLYRMHK